MAIRENIIKLREMNQITQEQLAEIAGVSRGAVSQWEGGFESRCPYHSSYMKYTALPAVL